MKPQHWLDYAIAQDANDALAGYRQQIAITDPGLIYLDGNSLGRLPKTAVELSRDLIERQWGDRLIRSWNESWFELPERIGDKIARIIGAQPGEVTIADSTSVNLFKLTVAALRAQSGRRQVVTDDLNFPSDLYILQSALDYCGGGHLTIVQSQDGITVPAQLLKDALSHSTALVSLSHTAFKSAFVHDMKALNDAAHAVGALTLWDLSHSAGAVPVDLAGTNTDLAVGCSYKYLNGGPGAPAYLFVRSELQQRLENPIAGWFGHSDPFAFIPDHHPAGGIRRFLTGTPPTCAVALIEPGVDLLLAAGMDQIRAKSVRQTEFLITLWEALLVPHGYGLGSPRNSAQRGSHVSFLHPEGWRINRALIEQLNVIPDFRAPNLIRLGVCPLYTTYRELFQAVQALRQVVVEGLYLNYSVQREGVT